YETARAVDAVLVTRDSHFRGVRDVRFLEFLARCDRLAPLPLSKERKRTPGKRTKSWSRCVARREGESHGLRHNPPTVEAPRRRTRLSHGDDAARLARRLQGRPLAVRLYFL